MKRELCIKVGKWNKSIILTVRQEGSAHCTLPALRVTVIRGRFSGKQLANKEDPLCMLQRNEKLRSELAVHFPGKYLYIEWLAEIMHELIIKIILLYFYAGCGVTSYWGWPHLKCWPRGQLFRYLRYFPQFLQSDHRIKISSSNYHLLLSFIKSIKSIHWCYAT